MMQNLFQCIYIIFLLKILPFYFYFPTLWSICFSKTRLSWIISYLSSNLLNIYTFISVLNNINFITINYLNVWRLRSLSVLDYDHLNLSVFDTKDLIISYILKITLITFPVTWFLTNFCHNPNRTLSSNP